MNPHPTVVFDLDGTLVDTAPDLINALNFVLNREGLPAVPLKSARNMIGAGARKLLERGQSPHTPVVVVENCSLANEHVFRLRLSELEAGLAACSGPVLVLIGEALAAR